MADPSRVGLKASADVLDHLLDDRLGNAVLECHESGDLDGVRIGSSRCSPCRAILASRRNARHAPGAHKRMSWIGHGVDKELLEVRSVFELRSML
jgi:hypothetical protein